jgi:hypothetical protein
MRAPIIILAAVTLLACAKDRDPLYDPLPDAGNCNTEIHLEAWSQETTLPNGSIEIVGTTRAPVGMTVRAIYVAAVRVPLTEHNYRAWSVRIPADHVSSATREGVATLNVIAFTSDGGCTTLPSPVLVRVDDDDAGR